MSPDMTSNQGLLLRRRKMWHSKSRGGCKTCKTRRVKCDELKPQCRRCVTAGRICAGYNEVPKPWMFEYGPVRSGDCGEEKALKGESEHPVTILGISVFDDVFSSPYATQNSKLAVDFWLQLTSPESNNCPVANALHTTLGSYVPQAAWHLKAVRHCLLSAASTALVLEARSANMGEHMESSLSKQSIIHMHLGIRAILEEKQTSLDSALSAMLMGIICAWTGRWEECKRNLKFCSDLSHELRANGVHITDDLLVAADTMSEVIRLLPPTAMHKTARMRYAYRVITSARSWIESVIPVLGQTTQYDPLNSALQGYRTRLTWIERQWQDLVCNKIEISPIGIEHTAFAPGVLHMQHRLEENTLSANFDLRLLTTQLTMGLKSTLLYGACGDAKRLREAAFACHVKLPALALTPESGERAILNAANHS